MDRPQKTPTIAKEARAAGCVDWTATALQAGSEGAAPSTCPFRQHLDGLTGVKTVAPYQNGQELDWVDCVDYTETRQNTPKHTKSTPKWQVRQLAIKCGGEGARSNAASSRVASSESAPNAANAANAAISFVQQLLASGFLAMTLTPVSRRHRRAASASRLLFSSSLCSFASNHSSQCPKWPFSSSRGPQRGSSEGVESPQNRL